MPSATYSSHTHDTGCETARYEKCVCHCRGMLHQSNVLKEAVSDTPELSPIESDKLLDELFGAAFGSLNANPKNDREIRRGRKWADSQSKKNPSQTHIEQRILDVPLRDILKRTYLFSKNGKRSWINFVESITLQRDWRTVADE